VHQSSRHASTPGKVCGVALVEVREDLLEVAADACTVDQRPVGICRDSKAVRNVHPERAKLAVHLAERSRLATHARHILQRDLVEPTDERGHRAARCNNPAHVTTGSVSTSPGRGRPLAFRSRRGLIVLVLLVSPRPNCRAFAFAVGASLAGSQ
jgi:hypothetical protein